MMQVEDLDILRPTARILRLGGKDIDVSFIPCGITFEVDKLVRDLQTINAEKIQENGDDTKHALNISIDLCVAFCSHKYPEMDRAWFASNVDVQQVKQFVEAIQEALIRAYAGVQVESKNAVAPRKRTK